jgi:hypothetical protein
VTFFGQPCAGLRWKIVGLEQFSLAQRKLKKEETVSERTESA